MSEIHIDRIVIRMKDVSPAAAKEMASGLGEQLMSDLIEVTSSPEGKHVRLSGVDAGIVREDESAGKNGLRKAVSHEIARSIGASVTNGRGVR